eukprot:CAMPEP_0185317902 /NCGR_PEP_ID=MMETSP1363-20130426/47962_1 /TAXON_ID=38817 /ORGANISM="Gephyrocapsa oceanica, Strain RCC1303" /LENGTH=166 /DNA_ID=CAMNT_0027916161 /DNA_START=144 /DNA_END=640 /DNA_ORIENTATION=-
MTRLALTQPTALWFSRRRALQRSGRRSRAHPHPPEGMHTLQTSMAQRACAAVGRSLHTKDDSQRVKRLSAEQPRGYLACASSLERRASTWSDLILLTASSGSISGARCPPAAAVAFWYIALWRRVALSSPPGTADTGRDVDEAASSLAAAIWLAGGLGGVSYHHSS